MQLYLGYFPVAFLGWSLNHQINIFLWNLLIFRINVTIVFEKYKVNRWWMRIILSLILHVRNRCNNKFNPVPNAFPFIIFSHVEVCICPSLNTYQNAQCTAYFRGELGSPSSTVLECNFIAKFHRVLNTVHDIDGFCNALVNGVLTHWSYLSIALCH